MNRFDRTTTIVELSVQPDKSIQKSDVSMKRPTVVAALIARVQGILAVGTSVQLRYRAVVETGPLDWSQPPALLVK